MCEISRYALSESAKQILKSGPRDVASIAQENGIGKEVMLQKLVEEAFRSHEWDMSLFVENLRGHCEIPIPELTSLIYVANLSQRQYQMCRNLLLKYNVTAFEPRYKVDAYKKSLCPSVALDHLSASVNVQDLFDSTLHAILSNEDLFDKLSDLPVDSLLTLSATVGLVGSGSHSRRHQLSSEVDDDNSFASSDSFLGVFKTPLCIHVSGVSDMVLWENPFPNSVFYARPIKLVKAKECRAFVASFFLNCKRVLMLSDFCMKFNVSRSKLSLTAKYR